jgi:hypothetical protein
MTLHSIRLCKPLGQEHYLIRAIPYQDSQQEAERLKAVHEARVKIVPGSERTISREGNSRHAWLSFIACSSRRMRTDAPVGVRP